MRAPRQCCARNRIPLVEFRFVDGCGYVDSGSTQRETVRHLAEADALGLYAHGRRARGALRPDLVRAERRERAPASSAPQSGSRSCCRRAGVASLTPRSAAGKTRTAGYHICSLCASTELPVVASCRCTSSGLPSDQPEVRGMDRRAFVTGLGAVLGAALVGEARQAGKV